MRARWADGSLGREYTPVILSVTNELPEDSWAHADEAAFNRLPPHVASGLLDCDAVPLLVRIQYLNMCQSIR